MANPQLILHDQRDDAISHRYSIQTERGDVWVMFDVPDTSPVEPDDVLKALQHRMSGMIPRER